MDELAGMLSGITQINVMQALMIIAWAWILLKFVQKFLPWLATQAPSQFRLQLLPLTPVLQLAIVGVTIIKIVSLIIDPTPENLLAVTGVVVIALGVTFQDYVSSFIAGIVTIYERPYRIGDWVRIGDDYGEVTAVRFRVIEMVTPDDTVVLIPHRKVWDSAIHNDNYGQREHLCVADFYLHPEHDAKLVRQHLYKVALTSPYLKLDRAIAVVVHEKPWGTHYRLKAYPIDGRDQFSFTSDMTVRGKAVLDELGVKPITVPVSAALMTT
jgi:small conductance mechanosensitive channel